MNETSIYPLKIPNYIKSGFLINIYEIIIDSFENERSELKG